MATPEIADLIADLTARPEFDCADTFNLCGATYIGEKLVNGSRRESCQFTCTETVSGNNQHLGPHHNHLQDIAPFVWQQTHIGDSNG